MSAACTWMCNQRGPAEGDFKKLRSNPQGQSSASAFLFTFVAFDKSESYCQGLASKKGMDATHKRLSAANETKA